MPDAAPPLLASTELSASNLWRATTTSAAQSRIGTGCKVIDQQALNGGFDYGDTVAISGAKGMAKSVVAMHVLVNSLLADEDSNGCVIDTTGSFDVVALAEIARLKVTDRGSQDGLTAQETAGRILDRVRIMRVFDFVGVVEAIAELRSFLESISLPMKEESHKTRESFREEVADSEDEEDMLEEEAQGLLASFLRSLHYMARKHSICALLLNGVVPLRRDSPYSSNDLPRKRYHQVEQDYHVSVFTSTTGKPSLGRTFTHNLDTHIFLSKVPKMRADAEAVFGGHGDDEGKSSAEWASVFEVISDRKDGRTGRWAAFTAEGVELRNAF
ncbi:MAG: hypothetical protein M1819_003892 [Sarea resinae]|nr:MAG: hypothetical protein M1819_003892 [Sarea resinae]